MVYDSEVNPPPRFLRSALPFVVAILRAAESAQSLWQALVCTHRIAV